MAGVRKGLAAYFLFTTKNAGTKNLDGKTPAMAYFNTLPQRQAAA